MEIKYETIRPSKRQKVFVVGDIHGCYDKFIEALEATDFNSEKDIVVSVGDLIDRGPKNKECVELLNLPWFKAVRGNHEDMYMTFHKSRDRDSGMHYEQNGGTWIYDHSEEEREYFFKLFDAMPLVILIEREDSTYVVSHAKFPFDSLEGFLNHKELSWEEIQELSSEDQYALLYQKSKEEELLWSRNDLGNSYPDITRSYHGHTPVKEVQRLGDSVYLDTGAVYESHGGYLTILEVGNDGL